jgi:hypothetical protein
LPCQQTTSTLDDGEEFNFSQVIGKNLATDRHHVALLQYLAHNVQYPSLRVPLETKIGTEGRKEGRVWNVWTDPEKGTQYYINTYLFPGLLMSSLDPIIDFDFGQVWTAAPLRPSVLPFGSNSVLAASVCCVAGCLEMVDRRSVGMGKPLVIESEHRRTLPVNH